MVRGIDKKLVGRTIKEIQLNGYEIRITFVDETIFIYEASDGGYSCWSFINEQGVEE